MPEKTRKFLRRQLDVYEDRREEKHDRFWTRVNRGMDALDHRPTLKRFFYILIGLELTYWFLVLVFPLQVFDLVQFLNDWSVKSLALLIGVVFGTGLYIVYVLFRFKFPDLEDNQAADGPVIGAFSQQRVIERKFRVWIASVVAGVLNVLALTGAELFRVGG